MIGGTNLIRLKKQLFVPVRDDRREGMTASFTEGSDPLSDSVRRSDHLPGQTSGRINEIALSCDFTDPLHWFPVATDRIVRLNPKVDRGV